MSIPHAGRIPLTPPFRAFTLMRRAILNHALVLANAGALAAGTMAGAALGFVFWWFAARAFPPAAVGLASAAISIMNLLGHAGEFGLGPLLLGHLPRIGRGAAALLCTALCTAAAACALFGLGYAGIARIAGIDLGTTLGSPQADGLFALGVALTGLTLVLDQGLTALLRAHLQMGRSVAFSILKLLLLVVVARWPGAGEAEIFGAWIAGQALSVAGLALYLARRRVRLWYPLRLSALTPLAREVVNHHALNFALQAPAFALPFIVTVTVSAETNAAFYAAWALVGVVLLVPAALTTVVYTTGARDPAHLRTRLLLSLALSTASGLAAGTIFLFLSPLILGLFNPSYPAIAGTSLQALGFGALGVMLKYHYVALERLHGRMARAAFWLTIGGALELAASAYGGLHGGLAGLTVGWLAAVALQGVCVVPSLLRAVRHQPGDTAPCVAPAPVADSLFGSGVR